MSDEANPDLIGRWDLSPRDEAAREQFGNVELEFFRDGRLTYKIRHETRVEIINLVWRTDGNVLVTDQPSSPREERAVFELTGDALRIEFSGAPVSLIRAAPDGRDSEQQRPAGEGPFQFLRRMLGI